jgi:SpoVK/Ycf46/Vps4 family AAA+-type ATPase
MSESDWQHANAEYLDRHLERLRLLLERRTLWLRSRWSAGEREQRGLDALDGMAIRDETIDRLFNAESFEDEAGFYGSDATARALGESLEAAARELAQRSGDLAAAGKPAALDVLRTVFNLSPFERDVVVLCAGAGIDPSFTRIFAYLQDDATLRHATAPLALSLFCRDRGQALAARRSFAPDGPLSRYSLVTRDALSQALRIDERVIDYLHGFNRLDERIGELLRPVPPSPEASCHVALATQLEEWLRNKSSHGRWHGINLFGPSGSGRRAMARTLCDRLGLHAYQLDPSRLPPPGRERQDWLRLLAREAVLSQIAPYIDAGEPDPEREPAAVYELLERMPVFFIVGSRSRVPVNRQMLAVTMPRIDAAGRKDLWERALAEAGASLNGEVTEVVEQFDFAPEMVAQAVAAARVRARLRNGAFGDAIGAADLWEACREQTSRRLDQLARPVTAVYTWDDIVLPEEIVRQLREITAQVGHRARVYHDWGFGAKLSRGRGVSALFAGVSGTGKTMAAEVLANHLRLDLYRVDLAGVVSKYIGETEKNLRKVFDAAERSGSILFFDEADALFGRRTEVKDSHDRFANIEVNYLLQRMEDYRGLSILATNRKTEVDRAFLRRLRFLVDFPFPDASQRLLIWHKVFPPETPLDDLDYELLSRMEIAGGSIRNIALAAAFLAAECGERVGMRQVIHATRREYAKMDKMISGQEFDRQYAKQQRGSLRAAGAE